MVIFTMEKSKRTLEEINDILTLAKLNASDLKSFSQTIYFTTEDFYENKYKLLQLDQYLLKEFQQGNILSIKGNDNDEVIINSETQTFQITCAETSNSLLLAKSVVLDGDIKEEEPHQISKVMIHGIFYGYLEGTIDKPHKKKICEILKTLVYKGPEFEFQVNKEQLYTFNQLNECVQASTQELKDILGSMCIVIIDGKIRLLDFEYHFRILSYMLKLIDENSWQLDEIDYEVTIDTLSNLVPNEILDNLFNKYTEKSKVVDGLQLYKYNESEVCKFLAKVLLHGARKFNLIDFLQAWKESVPEGMNPTEDMLYEIAIIDRKACPNIIWGFAESTLPHNINDRLKILFEIKEKWTVPEIYPYIKSLATEEVDVHALLEKYARASRMDGIRYYSGKHGK